MPADVFHDWLRRGARRSDSKHYRALLAEVRQAHAQARLTAEIELFRKEARVPG